ncbi:MAG TPA: phosphoserine phosphatase SerB [Rhodoblastus sp.]|nr:phosphoserine phosphatase SerB [Rhodoblastus sp.]
MSKTLSHVATLVCNPQTPILTVARAERARAALANAGGVKWLDPDIAADIAFAPEDGFEIVEIETTLRAALDHAAVDIVVQPVADRRKKLFVADMDSTIIGQECIDELADLVGLKAHVAAITERAMRGEIAFEPALRERVALLAGLAADVPEKVIAERITITPGARALVRTMRANGAYTALVSGGFTAFTSRIAAAVGFDENRANRLVIENGKFAGRVEEPILGAEAKLASIIELRDARGLTKAQTIAAGDGANDLPMLREAGLGAAFRAKPAVAAAADARIDHADLTALLFAQGFSRADFVE